MASSNERNQEEQLNTKIEELSKTITQHQKIMSRLLEDFEERNKYFDEFLETQRNIAVKLKEVSAEIKGVQITIKDITNAIDMKTLLSLISEAESSKNKLIESTAAMTGTIQTAPERIQATLVEMKTDLLESISKLGEFEKIWNDGRDKAINNMRTTVLNCNDALQAVLNTATTNLMESNSNYLQLLEEQLEHQIEALSQKTEKRFEKLLKRWEQLTLESMDKVERRLKDIEVAASRKV